LAWNEIKASWPLYGRYTKIFLAKSLSAMSDHCEMQEAIRQKAKVKR
jgi:hypothetical protein